MPVHDTIEAVVATGVGGNGKSTLLDLFELLLKPKFKASPRVVIRFDMSQILFKWGVNLKSPLGARIRKCLPPSALGYYAPDDVTMETLRVWLAEIRQSIPTARIFLLGGVPRTWPQWEEVLTIFSRAYPVNIDASRQQSDDSMFKRHKERQKQLMVQGATSEVRVEKELTPEILNRRWDQCVTGTFPMLKQMGTQCIHLSREVELTERLDMFLVELLKRAQGSPWKDIFQTALNRLRTPTHPIHREIHKILHPDDPMNVVTQDDPPVVRRYHFDTSRRPVGDSMLASNR
ncbi:MAG: hypothetical protein AAB381_01995 [Patescibacteria group bacterium]